MSDKGVSVANLAVGADQVAATVDSGAIVLKFRGAKLAGGSAASVLTIFDGPAANNKVLATLSAPIGGNDTLPIDEWYAAASSGSLHYTLSGTGALGQIYYSNG